MARTTKAPTAETPVLAIAGAFDYEQPGWLPSNSGLPWLDDLHRRHLDAVREFGRTVRACADLEAETEDAQRRWRRSVRDAVAAGDEPPARDFNPAVARARKEVAQEDVGQAREDVAVIVAAALAECRARQRELDDVVLSPALARALGAGGPGAQARMTRELERKLGEARAGTIIDVDDPRNREATEPEEVTA